MSIGAELIEPAVRNNTSSRPRRGSRRWRSEREDHWRKLIHGAVQCYQSECNAVRFKTDCVWLVAEVHCGGPRCPITGAKIFINGKAAVAQDLAALSCSGCGEPLHVFSVATYGEWQAAERRKDLTLMRGLKYCPTCHRAVDE